MNSLFRWSLIFQDLTLLSFSPVLGRQLPTELVEIALARADRAPEDTSGLPVLGHLRDRDTLRVDIQAPEKCASVCPG